MIFSRDVCDQLVEVAVTDDTPRLLFDDVLIGRQLRDLGVGLVDIGHLRMDFVHDVVIQPIPYPSPVLSYRIKNMRDRSLDLYYFRALLEGP